MKVIHQINSIQKELLVHRKMGQKIGFVPTMGALHAGHLSLVNRALQECEVVVVSIFVNPTQFNNPADLKLYPRTLEADCRLLESAGCTFVFAPSVVEMYPTEDLRMFDFHPLDSVMEGCYRAGHFNGVAQIVSKLFEAILPDKAYFGEKDFQQLAIICCMVKQLKLSVEIVPCPIVREADGLAMSSRNSRLLPDERQQTLQISKTLFASQQFAQTHSLEETKRFVIQEIETEERLKLEYFDIVDGNTLQPVQTWEETNNPVGCMALFCGEVRLIDNIKYTLTLEPQTI